MSFILDALRKSENDRRGQAQPTLAAAPQAAPAQKRSLWPPILAVVLAINAIVFGALILTRDEPAPVAAPLPPPAEPVAPPVRRAPAVKAAPAPRIEVPAPTPRPAPTRPPTTPAVPVAAAEPTPSQTIQEGLPNINMLRSTGQISVPNLRVDMHVYSGDASKRFVFINMSKYREGDRLAEGPIIKEITTEGVIMTHEGQKFRLDRD